MMVSKFLSNNQQRGYMKCVILLSMVFLMQACQYIPFIARAVEEDIAEEVVNIEKVQETKQTKWPW
jgi:hypothetical protein